MDTDPFDLRESWNLEPPFFLRRIDAKWHWTGEGDNHDERIRTILEKVLVPEENTISIYLVRNADDFRRVVVGLDTVRQNPGKSIRFVAITSAELQSFRLNSTSGETACRGANFLHHDIVVDDPKLLRELAEQMVAAGRQDRNFGKSILKMGREKAQCEFCSAFVPSWGCACDSAIGRQLIYHFKWWRRRLRLSKQQPGPG